MKPSSRRLLGAYADKIRLIRQKDLQSWSDEQLQKESRRLRAEARSGTPLDQLLIDAYALVGEAAYRTLNMRPYDVQIMAAAALMLERLEGSNDPALWEVFGLNSPASTRTYMMNDQYIQDKRSSWTGTTVFAYWIRRAFRPVFNSIFERLNQTAKSR